MTPSPAGPPWTPDQKLRHDATDEDMLGRVVWLNNNGYTDRSEAMAAREFAAAVVAERDRLAREAGEPVVGNEWCSCPLGEELGPAHDRCIEQLRAAPSRAGGVTRGANDRVIEDDEIVATGRFHMERMSDSAIWFSIEGATFMLAATKGKLVWNPQDTEWPGVEAPPPERDMTTTNETLPATFDFGAGLVAAHRHRNPNGSLGGWVADTARVSGEAWVADTARVFGEAWVFGEARVADTARVFGEARVSGEARVFGEAWVFG
jgi:hypothetical protein